MAGTPDRSGEEQKASGGPTPDERDPRLAVARETPPRVDQATAVFSVRDVAESKPGSATGSGNGSAPAEEAEADAGSGNGSASAAEPGNARLRNAVAAWVSSAGPAGGGGGGAETDAAEGAGADAAPSADAKSASDAEGAEPDADANADDGVEVEPAGAAAPEDSDADADADAQSKPTGDDAEPKPGKADADASKGDETEPEAKSGAGAKDDDAEPDAPKDADAERKAEPTVGDKPKPDTDADAKPDAEPTDADADDAKPIAAAAAAPEDTDAKPESKQKPEPKPESKPKTADAKPKPGADAPVDQPTAVFKAVAPPVDQPTTMLKSPAKTDAAKSAKSGTPPESAAERTSKFVPLKGLDSAAKAGTGKPAEPPVPERTTQQPLPPKPPLDLLAELTNTPAPPETRVRTTVRRVKVWTPLVLLLVVVFAVVQAVRPLPTPTLQLTAQESVSFDGGKPSVPWPGQGQAAMDVNGIGTFGTSGDQKPVPIASIAKVMTVYLILRDHPLKTGEKGPKIPVDAAAQKHYETGKAENESVVKVTEGQKISEYEALQAVMLPSANNIAKLLARWDTGSSSEDTFVDKMNKTAKELGMKNTTYTDPSGLDKTTVSTAEDLVKLGRAAMENPVFKDVSRQPSYVDLNGDKQNNFFGLVPTVAIGIKTGTTTAAGGNILFAAEKQVGGKTQTIIGAALGQYGRNGTANIDEVTGVVRKLIESGQSALTAKKIVKKGDVVGQVDDGLGGTAPVVATKDVTAVGWSGLTVKLKLGDKKGETPPHSAKAGTEVGVLSVGDGKNDAVEVPVALQKDLTEPGFGAKIKRVG
ncbi:D-alanyl-D-alanine carboxypeptidase [Streptomyces sp. NPDC050264]|uniref:D-alanyl-D-alanine carboxypeptidase n=1 Tax=Streptomyces sp. NPDC050264 TaxID=3155038 RepID=UPI00342CB86A